MINPLNDADLSQHIQEIHYSHCLIDRLMADGEGHKLFLLLKQMHQSADKAMERLNKLQLKWSKP